MIPTKKKTIKKTKKKREGNLNFLLRNATVEDIEGIFHLCEKAYPGMSPYPRDMLRGQINNYPEGHFVVEMDKTIIGYAASIRLPGDLALKPHTWREITGGGFGSSHRKDGEYLYGYEVCVDPEIRGHKIGQRLYNARKSLAKFLRLKGIVFGGRIPNLIKHIDEVKTAQKYLKLVEQKKINDPVLSFQMRNGFEILGVLDDYLSHDKESLGKAAHLLWKNPSYVEDNKKGKKQRAPDSVRVATIQYKQRKINSFEEFAQMVRYFVDVVSDYRCDFVLFPELFTMQLLSIQNEPVRPHEAFMHMDKYTKRLNDLFHKLSVKYNVNIIAGSHPTMVGKTMRNTCGIYLRDGQIHTQEKIHPTPDEKYWWNLEGGDKVKAINTDCGPIGVLICYDSEFPELSRHLVDQGINILFVPFFTDNRQAYCRVRFCCQARAIENQIYVALAGNVGNLPNVHNMDIQYAQSCILTPCDFAFARDGIASEATPNVEMVSLADLRLDALVEARNNGAVKNLKDRRHDLYSVKWHR